MQTFQHVYRSILVTILLLSKAKMLAPDGVTAAANSVRDETDYNIIPSTRK